ncbi:hypothetical protein [Bartonella sp. DGB2]|uniref:hypothetical protein n=1 Tax=Bartonella sp. DGB2 TaxID=3388426 RepID=UPI00398F9DB1
MYYAVVKEGVVINTIVAPEDYTYPFDDGAIAIPSDEAGIGWRYENGKFIPPEEAEIKRKMEEAPATSKKLAALVQAQKGEETQ